MPLEAPPPVRHVSSTPMSSTSASAMLDKYLKNSEIHAHLHPDAMITPRGVTFNAQGGALGNPLMHHLRRVAAGLHGEHLEADLSLLDLHDDHHHHVADIASTPEDGLQGMADYQPEQRGEEPDTRKEHVDDGAHTDKEAKKKAKKERHLQRKREKAAPKLHHAA
ncbi:hypothetical protein TUN199_03155 [Pyrenophora tritici-repentis]|nr:hypothetical protein Alg215_03780 [Pyrenophora tritici-repentis]KAI0613006.1 hypothetical protein TUN205_02769 [Pyrenophora tritici-repentis]KAI0624868.1 hypothetical protein TUN199_03155 [Pyrenophora tritici-repentis]PZD30719.1 hypothetical protein A1F96_04167 [Pyrenophora tritici-repentis]